jgi:hypothetical protein
MEGAGAAANDRTATADISMRRVDVTAEVFDCAKTDEVRATDARWLSPLWLREIGRIMRRFEKPMSKPEKSQQVTATRRESVGGRIAILAVLEVD